jgi:hypothetical protein
MFTKPAGLVTTRASGFGLIVLIFPGAGAGACGEAPWGNSAPWHRRRA